MGAFCVFALICRYELFHTRYSLFKQVYSHRVSKSIEYMICDVFKLADPVLHLSAATSSPEEYAKLTDCVLKQIEISTDPRLADARHLIMRIRTRQLYKLVDETVLPVEVPTVLGEVTATQILDCYPPSRDLLSEDDLHVQNLRINYAMKDKNPVDKSVWRRTDEAQQAAMGCPKPMRSESTADSFAPPLPVYLLSFLYQHQIFPQVESECEFPDSEAQSVAHHPSTLPGADPARLPARRDRGEDVRGA